jgi:hypothetical protein
MAGDCNTTPKCEHASVAEFGDMCSRMYTPLLDLGDGESRVEALRASPAAVQDSVATVQAHAVVEAVHALGGLLVTRVGNPAV